MKKILKSLLAVGIVVMIVAVVNAVEAKDKKKSIVSNEKYNEIALFNRVLNFVERQYVHTIDTKKLVYGAIKGMLEALDPHSSFLPPEVYHQMRNDTSGKFGGLGIEIWLGEDGLLTVVHPKLDTPAWEAGIKSGDKIIRINGEATKGLSLVEAVAKMRGKNGDAIKLTVFREKSDEIKEIKVVRREIKVKSVRYQNLADNIGYIRLIHFQEKSAREMKRALKKLEKKNKLKGLVLDLRNNPGGLLDEAVEVANLFIDNGVIVSTIGRDKKEEEVKKARSGIARKDLPVAVLVNGNSASAAEIVAGALKDHNRALILGSQTFGKGSVQTVIPLSDDMGLKLTIAIYHTPNGTSIQAKGITPHVYLDDLDPEAYSKAKRKGSFLREADLRNHFGNDGGLDKRHRKIGDYAKKRSKGKKDSKARKRIDPERDFQVQQAVGHLRSLDFYRRVLNPTDTAERKVGSKKGLKGKAKI